MGVGQNIMELKQEKAELQRVADDLVLLIDYANAPIFGIDWMGKLNEWNRKATEITGFPKEGIDHSLVRACITLWALPLRGTPPPPPAPSPPRALSPSASSSVPWHCRHLQDDGWRRD